MSEINSIANGSFVLGSTSAINFQAGPGITVTEPSAGTVRIGNDETVLWSGSCAFGESLTVSEAITGFERYKIYLRNTERQQQTVIERYADSSINTDSSNKIVTLECLQAGWSENTFLTFNVGNGAWDNSWTTFSYNGGYAGYFYATAWNYLPLNSAFLPVIQKVIGINRISGSNA